MKYWFLIVGNKSALLILLTLTFSLNCQASEVKPSLKKDLHNSQKVLPINNGRSEESFSISKRVRLLKKKTNHSKNSPYKIFQRGGFFGGNTVLLYLGGLLIVAGIFFIVDYATEQFFEYLGIWIGPILILLGIGLVILAFR